MLSSSGPNVSTAPVIVVGGGPVGMVLAMFLDQLGVRCLVVNDDPAPRQMPKGSTQNTRTLEHYRRLGIVADVRALGLPPDRNTDVVYFTRYAGWELQRIRMESEREKLARRDAAEPTDQILEPVLRCNQMQVEGQLFTHLATLPHVEMRFGWHCSGLVEDDAGVTVELEERASGRRESHRAAYVAGCDGGQSVVRRTLGIRYGGGEAARQAYLGGPMVSAHVRAPALHEQVIRTPGWQYWAVNSVVRSNTVCIDGHAELLFNTRLRDGEVPDAHMIERAFVASVGKPIPMELIGYATWTAGQALVAESFGTDRVLLAGDSAHLFTPTGGFGVNTGVDDTANLAWKLAAMVQGWGGPRLPGSYETERRPIALRNTSAARALARNVGAVPVGAAIEEDSPEGAAAREETRARLAGFDREFSSLGVQLGARYDGSPVIVSDRTQPPPDVPERYTPSACPGGRAPHLWLSDGGSLFDRLGPGFTLLCLGGSDDGTQRLLQAAQARGVPLGLVEVHEPWGRELYERDLALIRPDQHVAWRGDRLPEDVGELLARVTGW